MRLKKGRLRYAIIGHALRLLGRHGGLLLRGAGASKSLPAVPDLVRMLQAWGQGSMPAAGTEHHELLAQFPKLVDVTVEDHRINHDGRVIVARSYRPMNSHPSQALVWVHGGAFLMGDLDMPESHWVGLMLAASGFSVIALDYVKAISGKQHADLNQDVLTGWSWSVDQLSKQGIDRGQIHIGGASAGANLVACACKALRDSDAKLPASLLLMYPLLHGVLPEVPVELLTQVRTDPRAICFESDWIADLGMHYAGPSALHSDPYAFAASGRLDGLPPTLIVNCSVDTLRVSGETFAEQLLRDGGVVSVSNMEGAVHGSLNTPNRPEAEQMLASMAEWMDSCVGVLQGEQNSDED